MSAGDSSLRIVVTGLVGAYPIGGVSWDYLQYPIGLSRLGHEVVYHEDTRFWPYHPIENTRVETAAYSVEYISRFFRNYAPELARRWHYRHLGVESFGLSDTEFQSFARSADLYLDVSAASVFPTTLGPRCLTAILDTDPGFNQICLCGRPEWLTDAEWVGRVKQFRSYDRYLTYAENIGREDCLVPDLDVDWITTRMPMVESLWRDISMASSGAPWSTVMTWNDFPGRLIYAGRQYGSKGVEFARIASLPSRVSATLRIAIGGAAPRQELVEHGWHVVDAPSVTLTPENYRDFIAQSRGEISTAKNVYVDMKTGWFSCRTACYLAAGRPAVVQDTGFSKYIPIGKGLLAFETLEQASLGIDAVEADYPTHASAARDIAAEHFGSDKVLSRMLDSVFATR